MPVAVACLKSIEQTLPSNLKRDLPYEGRFIDGIRATPQARHDMKLAFLALFAALCLPTWADTPDVSIPAATIERIKPTDLVEVTGTNDAGGAENFSIHNAKALAQFIGFLTSERYTAVPKSLKPEFKQRSIYQVRLSAQGQTLLELSIIGDSILDIPNEDAYYMESDRHSDNLLAPLLRLR